MSFLRTPKKCIHQLNVRGMASSSHGSTKEDSSPPDTETVIDSTASLNTTLSEMVRDKRVMTPAISEMSVKEERKCLGEIRSRGPNISPEYVLQNGWKAVRMLEQLCT
jgi:hypothetical protein